MVKDSLIELYFTNCQQLPDYVADYWLGKFAILLLEKGYGYGKQTIVNVRLGLVD